MTQNKQQQHIEMLHPENVHHLKFLTTDYFSVANRLIAFSFRHHFASYYVCKCIHTVFLVCVCMSVKCGYASVSMHACVFVRVYVCVSWFNVIRAPK